MGIEIKSSSGGGFPVNAIVPINDTQDLREKNGQSWLKSGVIETDASLYPDARLSLFGVTEQSKTPVDDTQTPELPRYIDAAENYIVASSNDALYKLDNNLNYTGVSVNLRSGEVLICSQSDFYWTARFGGASTMYQRDSNLNLTGLSIPLSEDSGRATWNSLLEVFAFVDGSDSLSYFTLSGQKTFIKQLPSDLRSFTYIESENIYIGVRDLGSDEVLSRYDGDFNYINDLTGEYYELRNLCYSKMRDELLTLGRDGTGDQTNYITPFKLNRGVGLSVTSNDSDTGLPYYVRVK